MASVVPAAPARLPHLRDAEVALGDGPDGDPRRQRRRQDEPARGALLRLHRRARAGPRNERELVRFDAPATRVERRRQRDRDGEHALAVGFEPGEAKRLTADGAPVERLLDVPARPLVSVFLPDRLELVKGPPALRRAHLDQLVAALWPARSGDAPRLRARRSRSATRCWRACAPAASPATRCAPGTSSSPATALALRDDRERSGRAGRADRRVARPRTSGWPATLELRYRPRTPRGDAPRSFAAELAERARRRPRARLHRARPAPRRRSLLLRDGRELRAYGSQGEQRLALLALLLAEREALERGARRRAAAAARRRDERARPAASRGAARARLARGPERRHDDRPRARAATGGGARRRALRGASDGDGPARRPRA